jgi:hypothetical protein
MLQILQFAATWSTCLFAGAAVYINLAEHPARMGCDTKTAATVWAPSYKKATVMQATLAIVGFLSGLGVWLLEGGVGWLIGALFIGSVIPFTFIVMMPTNHKLLESGRDLSSEATRTLLDRWGKRHAVRSGLSLIASVLYVVLLLTPTSVNL